MKIKQILLASLALLTIPTAAKAAGNSVGYAYAQIYQSNSTVTLLDVTAGSFFRAYVTGLKCIFPSNPGGATIKVTISAVTDSSFIVDPGYFQQESNGAGQLVSDWVVFPFANFGTHLVVKLNNTNLVTATVNCWATYATAPQVE